MTELYDTIGDGYRRLRKPDPRIGAAILRGLDGAASIVNVGAGTGSYEPADRRVVAVEPSMTMIRQRDAAAPPAVRASASALPFRDGAFEASLAILTVHHWPDPRAGLQELRRAARKRTVILTWDPTCQGFWLTDYFPEILEIDRRIFPPLEEIRSQLGRARVVDVPIPHDCIDGFLGAYWRRPRAYLSASVRSAISTFSRLGDVARGLARLEADLESGLWNRRYGEAVSRRTLDLGYRLVIAK
ncbi:MAG: class I SAM-dependent methyltransferase [bacterium]